MNVQACMWTIYEGDIGVEYENGVLSFIPKYIMLYWVHTFVRVVINMVALSGTNTIFPVVRAMQIYMLITCNFSVYSVILCNLLNKNLLRDDRDNKEMNERIVADLCVR